jgi:hypothetical protein
MRSGYLGIHPPQPSAKWRACAALDAQLLDPCHLLYVWSTVDREVSDLRQ